MQMSKPLRVLIVEDSEDDALLIIEELKDGGYDPEFERVETREAMKAALDRQVWDIIIADYRLPSFSGLDALKIACEDPDICPFIIVSGQISEETAVNAMRTGAKDYVLKGNLVRLVPAVERELQEVEVHRKRRQAEEALRESEEKYRILVERSNDGVVVLQETLVKLVNQRFVEMSGYPAEVLLNTPFTDYLTPEENALLHDRYKRRMAGEDVPSIYETTMTRSDGRKINFEISAGIITFQGKPADLVLFRDITERKKTEAALERALDEAMRESERARALESIAEAGITTTDLQELLDSLVHRIANVLNAHSCSIWTLDEETHEFIVSAEYGIPGIVGDRLDSDKGIAGIIYKERRPVFTADAQHDPLVMHYAIKEQGIKALLSVPMIVRDKLLGMARVYMLETREFTEDEAGLLQAMASTAAQSIENAKLYDALTNSRNELEEALNRERHYSLLLQRAMLPSEPVIGPGYDVGAEYVPVFVNREIGGDFYDVFRVGDCRAGVLIGDVSGKGLEAAALAATTRSTVHAFVHETASAAEALERANSVLYSRQVDFDSFVTVFLVIIDLCSGDISYASAGHPPALICRSEDQSDFLEFGQMPLVLVESQKFEEHSLHFEFGDKLVLYTDGITESRKGKEMLELEGVKCAIKQNSNLHAKELASTILATATDWAGGKLTDDAAVVIIERLPPA